MFSPKTTLEIELTYTDWDIACFLSLGVINGVTNLFGIIGQEEKKLSIAAKHISLS